MNNLKIIINIFLIIILTSLISTNILAETTTRDVELKIILDDISPEYEYIKIFKVENLDHTQGTTDLLYFLLNATLKSIDVINKTSNESYFDESINESQSQSFNESQSYNDSTINESLSELINESNESNNIIKSWNITRSINKYTETGLGEIILNTGKYELCAEIKPINFIDLNLTNNKICKIIWTNDYVNEYLNQENETNQTNQTDGENETNELHICDCELEIITEKNIYANNEQVSYIIKDCSDDGTYKNEIEYWIEDLFEKIIKTKFKTTSKNTKTYTPKIQEIEKTFLIKSKMSNCTQIYEKVITIKNQEEEQKQTFIEITTQNEAKIGDIISVELKGYKAQTLKTLITMQLELNGKKQSDILKIYVPKQNTEFHFKMPFKIPEKLPNGLNEYELIISGLDIETKTIILIDNPEENDDEVNNKLNAEQENNNVNFIKSFYTRKQKFAEEINIMLTLDNSINSKIKITTQIETKEIIVKNTTITTPIKIKHPNETIIAELIIENETKDVKLLKLNLKTDELNDENKIEINENSNQENETNQINKSNNNIDDELINSSFNQNNQEKLKTNEQKSNDSITNKQKITLNAIAIQIPNNIKEYKKQIIFTIICIISLTFLFKKEIKELIIRIKKSLKII